jgi:primosomal protein N' (replication factor Y)
VGLTAEKTEIYDLEKIKNISEVIDESPVLPEELWKTINWFGVTWFTGIGMAAKTLLPSRFFDAEYLEFLPEKEKKTKSADVRYVYEPHDSDRYKTYIEMLESSQSENLVLFPEVSSAKIFWDKLPESVRQNGVLWPSASASKQWEIWKKTRTGEISFVVGPPGASFLPFKNISRIIVEDEFNGAWRTLKRPFFHRRTLLAARARFAGSELVLGGRMPSAKVFQQYEGPLGNEGISGRVVFVDMRDSANSAVAGVKEALPVSRPLVRETLECRKNGGWAFWILDRKGYAGEIFCEECGSAVRCSRCGGVMRWDGRNNRLVCLNCDLKITVPDKCPVCGGFFLEGHRPGLEALADSARLLLKRTCGEVIILQDEGCYKKLSVKALLKENPGGALIVGTRGTLALADDLAPGMIGWIDADAEARVAEYDAKTRAYALVWESAWRGCGADGRKIVIQSRRPGKGWQCGLLRGWQNFWKTELRERSIWDLPPFVPMLKINMPGGFGKQFSSELEREEFEYWTSEELNDVIWVRTRRFSLLRKLLEPYYNIGNSRRGMPDVELFLD